MKNEIRKEIIKLTQEIEKELGKAFSKLEDNPKIYNSGKVLISYYQIILGALVQLNKIINVVKK